MTGLRNTSMRELGVGAKFAAVKGISSRAHGSRGISLSGPAAHTYYQVL